MGRFVPITVTTVIAEKAVPVVTAAKAYYDGKQCWQYKVVYDRPGSYTWTAPTNAVCVRTVLVGGGGKPKCSGTSFGGGTCCSSAGSGGAYSEKCHGVTAGTTTFNLVVGRQEQDTTLACNSVAVHTAGGAAGCVQGVATGGDWNSTGGLGGWGCTYCGGSYSHGTQCFYTCFANCCGYCIAYVCNPTGTCGDCAASFAGGGSAGSPRALTGGCASCICQYVSSSVAGGGAGIGDVCCNIPVWHYPCCNCICTVWFCCEATKPCYNYPTSNQGGGGSEARCNFSCRSTTQTCTWGYWKSGDGGPGGLTDESSTYGWEFEWGYQGNCVYPFGIRCMGQISQPRCASSAPQNVCVLNQQQWDIQNISGSGSPGTGLLYCSSCYPYDSNSTPRPRNAGEGAGTGGFSLYKCDAESMDDLGIGYMSSSGYNMLNWLKICQLGMCGQCDQAWLMQDGLFPFFITCAGTLGGSGGVGICGYTSKAGKGGGGGQSKNQILCICYGGAFNCCNQVASTPLAFPPCLLDQMVSNAGTGMAIIYYRES